VGGDGKKIEGEPEENTWILAVVKRCINMDKNRYVYSQEISASPILLHRYEVQDVDEDGQPGP
jgi:hypothetical protein